ncbi:glycosyltransferase [Oceanisphaera avium]|uniref:Glycosyltransferase 2-like domain-containing protein n=1 Tax=Oceanisphaera avium TaxID=1903694 RepID=A0A1Y0CVB6_9GAMM|nr:glycosyltransferase [Oceanisphaera avium]ART78825.1 hypothetical protein CBP12_00535 [Oceanisphaera avium]
MKYVNKISIVTLTYKNWHLLNNAINSLASQVIDKYYEVEYIIVDDGTVGFNVSYVEDLLCKLRALNFECHLIINEKNLGTVASFNNAIKKSTGDLIVPLSADDELYDENVIAKIIDKFNSNKCLLLTALRVPVRNEKELYVLPEKKYWNLFHFPKKLHEKISLNGNIISGACTYYHKNIFKKVGMFDEDYRLIEDYPFYLEVLSKGISIPLLKVKAIKYSMQGVSTNHRVSPLFTKDMNLLLQRILKEGEFNFFEKRYFHFQRCLPVTEKVRVKNIVLYPEQLALWVLRNVKKLIWRK